METRLKEHLNDNIGTYHVDMEARVTFLPVCNLPNISRIGRNRHLKIQYKVKSKTPQIRVDIVMFLSISASTNATYQGLYTELQLYHN